VDAKSGAIIHGFSGMASLQVGISVKKRWFIYQAFPLYRGEAERGKGILLENEMG